MKYNKNSYKDDAYKKNYRRNAKKSKLKLSNNIKNNNTILEELNIKIINNIKKIKKLINVNNNSIKETRYLGKGQVIDLTKDCQDLIVYKNTTVNKEECIICFNNNYNIIFKCNHNACKDCYTMLVKYTNTCPVCRKNTIDN